MRHVAAGLTAALLLLGCPGVADTSAARQAGRVRPLGSGGPCSASQLAAIEQAKRGICAAVAEPSGACRATLRRLAAERSFDRQCARTLEFRCGGPLCGKFAPTALLSDRGIIELGDGAFVGGAGCGGRDRPTAGPAHTLAHEMAHAARVRGEGGAEEIAYACRGVKSSGSGPELKLWPDSRG
jgi:hypothetical protein